MKYIKIIDLGGMKCSRSATVEGVMLSARAQAMQSLRDCGWGDAVWPGTDHAVATGLGIGRIESIYELLV